MAPVSLPTGRPQRPDRPQRPEPSRESEYRQGGSSSVRLHSAYTRRTGLGSARDNELYALVTEPPGLGTVTR